MWQTRDSMPFFFNAPAPTQIYTLSLHDALPILRRPACPPRLPPAAPPRRANCGRPDRARSEEHTSELQSRENLVCRLLLEKKKKKLRKRQATEMQDEISELDVAHTQGLDRRPAD